MAHCQSQGSNSSHWYFIDTSFSHPRNAIVAANDTDDCTEQRGQECRTSKKTENHKRQNAVMVDVFCDRNVETEGEEEQNN